MTAQSPFTDSPIPPSGNNPPTELKKNIPWARIVRGDTQETMPLITPPPPPPPPAEAAVAAEDQVLPLPADHIDADVGNAGSPKKAEENQPIAPPEPAEEQAVSFPGDHIDTAVDTGSPKKPAWNKPIGGAVGVSPLTIGGITSWPALSDSTRPAAKSTPDSSKRPAAADKQPVSISKAPVASHLAPKQAGRSSNTGTNNMEAADRHRWTARRGGNHAVRNSHGSFFLPMPPPPLPGPPPFPCYELAYGHHPHMFPMVGNPHFPFDQSPGKMNLVPRPPGESSHLGTNRHGQDRNWKAAQNSKFRDGNFGTGPFRGFPSSPLPPPPPPPPPPMRPFVSPIRYDAAGFPWVIAPPGSSYYSPPQGGVVSMTEPANSLIRQVDYYFSDENLVKDDFLRSNMDDQGWVPVTLIAGFPRVQHITNDVGLILNYLKASMVVEVSKGKVRRIRDWRKWIPISRMPTSDGSRIEEKGESSSSSDEPSPSPDEPSPSPDEPSSST